MKIFKNNKIKMNKFNQKDGNKSALGNDDNSVGSMNNNNGNGNNHGISKIKGAGRLYK